MMGYEITDTRQADKMTPGGAIQTVYQVWITTDNGTTGMLEVPESKWNNEDLPALLAEKERELDLPYTIAGA